MDKYLVRKLNVTENDIIEVSVPGSKSVTNRALLLAAVSNGTTELQGALFSDDSRHFTDSLIRLGFEVETDEVARTIRVKGEGGRIPEDGATIDVGSAGTAARFLTAMLGLSGGHYTINASDQMKKRPMKPLFDVLEQLGTDIDYLEEEYHLPVRINGRRDTGVNSITIDTDESTQYLSAMLMIGPAVKGGLNIKVTGSRKTGSYVNITRRMMNSFGCDIAYEDEKYIIAPGDSYDIPSDFKYCVEPDVSAACYFYGMGAILGCRARVRNVHFDTTQGDINFIRALEKMGCKVQDEEQGILLTGPEKGHLKGITIDMKNFSDQALTMAAVAVFADSATTIQNIGHIRKQESDRLSAMADALKRMGIKCDEDEDSIVIYPGLPGECEIETYEDHRVAMSFTLPGIKEGGITILNPRCCRKTFEDYFDVIDSLYL